MKSQAASKEVNFVCKNSQKNSSKGHIQSRDDSHGSSEWPEQDWNKYLKPDTRENFSQRRYSWMQITEEAFVNSQARYSPSSLWKRTSGQCLIILECNTLGWHDQYRYFLHNQVFATQEHSHPLEGRMATPSAKSAQSHTSNIGLETSFSWVYISSLGLVILLRVNGTIKIMPCAWIRRIL